MTHPLEAAADAIAQELRIQGRSALERREAMTLFERYALDPIAPLRDGAVQIWSKFERRWVVFVPFDSQIDSLLSWVNVSALEATGRADFRNVVEEKSRQMGETWAACYGLLWAVQYVPEFQALAHHYRSAEIDDGGERSTLKSLFGKIRQMHRRWPQEKARARLRFRPYSREPAKIENLDRPGSTVMGGVAATDPGRGGSFDAILWDEVAFTPWGEAVHASFSDACPHGRFYLSTVNGVTVHSRLADAPPAGWIKLRHHWSGHPIYGEDAHVAGTRDDCELCLGVVAGVAWDPENPRAHRYPGRLASPWYDEAVLDKTDEQVARELDIDAERALTERVYSEAQADRHRAGVIPLEPTVPIELAWDYGLDCTAIPILQNAPAEVRVVGYVEVSDMTPDQVSEAVKAELRDLGVREADLTPAATRTLLAYGDPAGEARSLSTGLPLTTDYARQGWSILPPPPHLTRTVEPSITAVKRLLMGIPKPIRFSDRESVRVLWRHLTNNRWPTDKLGRRRIGATRPLDDEHNHGPRALAYWAVARFPPPIEEELEGDDWERHGDTPRSSYAGVEAEPLGYGANL